MTRPPTLGVSSSQRYSVFDFNKDDERVEKASEKLLRRFGNPNKRKRDFSSPVTKYKFLECFAGCTKTQEKESKSEPIVIDDGPIDVGLRHALSEEISNQLVDLDANSNQTEGNYHKPSSSTPMCMVQEDDDVKEISCSDPLVVSSSSNYENKSVDMVSDDDGRSGISSSSISVSTLEENEAPSEDPAVSDPSEDMQECCSVGHKIDILNNAVVVFPDFIIYEDRYCTESRLTFSSSCIRVEGSTVNGAKGSFNAEWAIDDIINIESEWCGRVETAIINLSLKPKVSKRSGTANEISGIDMLKFSVYDPDWFEGQKAIKSLDVKYRDSWNFISDNDREKDAADFSGFNNRVIPKPYFSVLDTFEDVIYPKGDPDAISISKRDVELLRPETFINDTIIDFYIKFLKNKIQPEDQHKFHFFNSFFFRKLADLDKDPCNACEGRAAFQRVRKWTKKVNLFEKDYIFIPVNYSLHWSLIIICHPGEVACFRDDESEMALRVPCILHMDSIRGSHRGLKNLFQSYLCEEWKERHRDALEDVSSKFSHLRFVPLELPQQENSFDCGLFLLHYVELFLEEVPVNFSPFKITKFSKFLNRNWFLPEEASLKRAQIQKLICKILEDQSQKVPHADPCSQFVDADEQEAGIEFVKEKDSQLEMFRVDSSSLNTQLGIGISLPSTSLSQGVWQQFNDLGLDSGELFEPETSKRLFSHGTYPLMRASRPSFMSPIKEAEEAGELISDSSSDTEDCYPIAELATESPHSCFHNMQSYEYYGNDLYDGTSISESQKSSEIGVDEDHSHQEYHSHQEFEDFGHPKETERQESSPTSPEDLSTHIVEDSQETNCIHNGNDPAPSDGEIDSKESNVKTNNVSPSKEDLVSESDEQAAKRSKLMSSGGGR